MKTPPFPKTALALAFISIPAFAAKAEVEEQPVATAEKLSIAPDSHPFGRFLDITSYSPTFGLELWESHEDSLGEVAFPGGHQLNNEKEDSEKMKRREASPARNNNIRLAQEYLEKAKKRITSSTEASVKEALAKENILWTNDYEKLGLNRQLRFRDETGSAILLRIREKFQMLNEETGGAQFLYADDRKSSDSGYTFKGALMADFYLNSLYNLDSSFNNTNPLWIENPFRFWVRAGAEWDADTLDAKNERDFSRQYLLLNFQGNPDQNAKILGIPGLEVTSPQFLQIGAVHEENHVTDEESLRWIVGWQPRFVVAEGWFGTDIGRGFSLNNRMYYREGGHFAELATARQPSDGETTSDANDIVSKRSKIFSFINPKVDIEGSSDSR